jgi:hypothetical protein
VYPTSRLLSIHISEAHDSFFQAKVARGFLMVITSIPQHLHDFFTAKVSNPFIKMHITQINQILHNLNISSSFRCL